MSRDAYPLNQTLDIFASDEPEDQLLQSCYPAPDRFPLNLDGLKVENVVLPDLRGSASPLIITGFASIDRLLDYCCDHCSNPESEVRLLIGQEPFPSRRDTFTVNRADLTSEAEAYWLSQGISLLYSAKVIEMVDLLKSGRVVARYMPGRRRLHAKIYSGDTGITIGSSNFTEPGLRTQIEANARFSATKEPKRFTELTAIAQNYWERSVSYQQQLIALLEKMLRVVSWEEALARASAELLEGEWAEKYLQGDYLTATGNLWPSQKQGIAQALTVLSNQGSVLIADATGAGKTRMGTYLIGAVQDQIVRSGRMRQGKAIMICPPAVEENWIRECSQNSVSLETFSHGKLSHKRARRHELTIDALRRAQILCVDEGHNFLNFKSNRTQELLRNMADHVVLLTATPINRSVVDLLRIADMLGADNLSPSILQAFDKMLGVKSINRQLTEPELEELRKEIRRFTVRRTKRQLNKQIDKDPQAYCDQDGNRCRFPDHLPKVYNLGESTSDCVLAEEIQRLTGELYAVTHFIRPIDMPAVLQGQGVSESRYLEGRLHSAKKLARYIVMASLRSSRAALLEHIEGTIAAIKYFHLDQFHKGNNTGNVILQLKKIQGQVPDNKLSIALPDWLTSSEVHAEACRHDQSIYEQIAECTRRMSESREQTKAGKLYELLAHHSLILAFDSRPITLALIDQLLRERGGVETILAFGSAGAERNKILKNFARGSQTTGIIGLCSDSMSEGVNLQQASCLVHLDMPSVVRIAEQRAGRVDRMDSPHKSIEIWWPEDAEQFALRSDERFIERYETVEQLLGSNMPLPESMRTSQSEVVHAQDMIHQAETADEHWDGIDDAFQPVRSLVEGEHAIVGEDVYEHYRHTRERVLSRVSLVSAQKPWALFCVTGGSFGAPRWVLIPGQNSKPITELSQISNTLRERLTSCTENRKLDGKSSQTLQHFLEMLADNEKNLLAQKKRRALDELSFVIQKLLASTTQQKTIDHLLRLKQLLESPSKDQQPDWDEVASRWLDMIRPVWFERLTGRRNKPLLLKDIRKDLLARPDWLIKSLEENFREFPLLPSIEERIKACIVGVN
ncbi:MAG: helicase [Gammaproteobacteria bacterium]|nr:MAG: helicase [Gammaproteobacteria bacterium]